MTSSGTSSREDGGLVCLRRVSLRAWSRRPGSVVSFRRRRMHGWPLDRDRHGPCLTLNMRRTRPVAETRPRSKRDGEGTAHTGRDRADIATATSD